MEQEKPNASELSEMTDVVLAASPDLSLEQQLRLATSQDDIVRFLLAQNPTVRTEVLEKLARTEDVFNVVAEILSNPACTPEVRSLIAADWVKVIDEHNASRASEDDPESGHQQI